MSDARQKHIVLNLNRCLIYIFSLAGLVWDDKGLCIIALTLWVWLPTFTKVELKIAGCFSKVCISKGRTISQSMMKRNMSEDVRNIVQ